MYFAPGATHAPHHVPKEWIEKYKGKFAHGWDRQREITFERQKELGVIGPDAVLTPAARGDPGLGRHGSCAQAGAGTRDGGVRRIHGAHRPSRRPVDRGDRTDTGRHAGLRHRRRQRRFGGGHAAGRVQRDGQLQRHGRPRDTRIPGVQARRVRRRRLLRPLCGRLGVGDGYALPVDQAGGVALGRHPQRHHRALAQGN